MAEAMFMPIMLRVDDPGKVSALARNEANNPYSNADFSFGRFVEDRPDSLDAFDYRIARKQYEFQKGTLTKFLEKLT